MTAKLRAEAVPPAGCAATVLLVDDDPIVLRSIARQLRDRGYVVHTASDGSSAIEQLRSHRYATVLSDIAMPNLDGIELLQAIRGQDPQVPVVLITGEPTLDTAMQALEYGAFHYLAKPIACEELERILHRAVEQHRRLHAEAALRDAFRASLEGLWVAYHPIVCAASRQVYGYEALVRSTVPPLTQPAALLETAERLGQLEGLGRSVRDRVVQSFAQLHDDQALLFVNVRPSDLLDPVLSSPSAPLSRLARRVVLEITERTSIEHIRDVRSRVRRLRELGFRIAVDDLGAGYAGLASFAELEPEFVKLDMTLVRDVHQSPVKQKVVRSMAALGKDMGMRVVAEGIETVEERDAVIELGCDLLQGFYFAQPDQPFPTIRW
jgi:EAL domain-containing protein (putative c-di-GMP-specific phosphodiesterase class I)